MTKNKDKKNSEKLAKKEKKYMKIRRKKNLLLAGIGYHLDNIDRRLMDIRDKEENLRPELTFNEFEFKMNKDKMFEVNFNITEAGIMHIKGNFWYCLNMLNILKKTGKAIEEIKKEKENKE